MNTGTRAEGGPERGCVADVSSQAVVSISRPQESTRWEQASFLLSITQNRVTGTNFLVFMSDR